MEASNNEVRTGIQPASPFFNFPLLAYDAIFSCLNISSIRTCRLVCSEWYVVILRLYSNPNCFYVQTAKYAWNTTKCLEENLKKGFEMKIYEDDNAPVENLKLENVSLVDCEKVLKKSADFRETINNVTALNLTNAFFGDCATFLQFLSRFKKLRKLELVHGTFSSLIDMSVFHLRWYLVTDQFGETKLPDSLQTLCIEIKQDSSSAPLLFEILNAKLQNLKDFQLKVIPCNDGWFRRTVMTTTLHYIISPLERSTFFLCWFLGHLLLKNEKSLKSLRIDWKMDGTTFVLRPDQLNVNDSVTGQFTILFRAFEPLLLATNQLKLNELSLNLGNISTRCQQFNDVLVPMLTLQIQKGLRNIKIGTLQSPIHFPHDMYRRIFPEFNNGDDFLKFLNSMKLELKLELLLIGTKAFAQGTQTFLTDLYSWLYIRELGIKIIQPLVVENSFTEFAEVLPDYIISNGNVGAGDHVLGIVGNGNNGGGGDDSSFRILFCRLTTLKIHLGQKNLKQFNICRISYQCHFLRVLEIIDGPSSAYKNKKLDKGKISSASVLDLDFRFIISNLKTLTSLTIWANLELITDFAFIGCPKENCQDCSSPDTVNTMAPFKENLTEILKNEIKMEATHFDYNSNIQNLLHAQVSNLRGLQKLSLRGVGMGLTDAIVSCFVSDDNASKLSDLERVEIRGTHKLSKTGYQTLKKVIKEVDF